MSKRKTTTRELENKYSIIVSIGYCNAQNLLRTVAATAYSCGGCGWNYDAYEIKAPNGNYICLATGYRKTPKSTIDIDVRPYEKRASEIWNSNAPNWEQKNEIAEKILNEFLTACVDEYHKKHAKNKED